MFGLMLAYITAALYNVVVKREVTKGGGNLLDWKQEFFWCFVGSIMGTAMGELLQALKEKTSKRSGKHFKRS